MSTIVAAGFQLGASGQIAVGQVSSELQAEWNLFKDNRTYRLSVVINNISGTGTLAIQNPITGDNPAFNPSYSQLQYSCLYRTPALSSGGAANVFSGILLNPSSAFTGTYDVYVVVEELFGEVHAQNPGVTA